MAKTARERQADYRARRREKGLCLEAGCFRYTDQGRCGVCRDKVRARRRIRPAAYRRRTKADLESENETLRAELTSANRDYRALHERHKSLEADSRDLDGADYDALSAFTPTQLQNWVTVAARRANNGDGRPAHQAVRWVEGNIPNSSGQAS